jgi:hypothetical protein
MSADSHHVEITGGNVRVVPMKGVRSRNPIVQRSAGGFVGLIGSVGTESIEGIPTARWIERFSAQHPHDGVGAFCNRLASTLTSIWALTGAPAVLEILLAGEIRGDLQFWYVRNSDGLDNAWTHKAPARKFTAENDLDANYVPSDRRPGESKDALLDRVLYSFRQGVLVPAAPVFDAFAGLMHGIYASRTPGFAPMNELDDLGHYARVRMEFLKRLCTDKYGIYSPGVPSPIGGDVHVLGVSPKGEIKRFAKGRQEVRVLVPGR